MRLRGKGASTSTYGLDGVATGKKGRFAVFLARFLVRGAEICV